MYDLIIRNGTVIDGSGDKRFNADIAIKDGKIAKIGEISESANLEVDAKNKLVTPGWVDIHTHYDGQATWDPLLTPSSWHGVTTVVMGNCGVGFAPVKPEDREFLIELMEGVEDIPGAALAEGIDWQWETFPEYLDALEKIPRAIDVAAQVLPLLVPQTGRCLAISVNDRRSSTLYSAVIGREHNHCVGAGDFLEHLEQGGVLEPRLHERTEPGFVRCYFQQQIRLRAAVDEHIEKIVHHRDQGH